jgi:small-conductance mechanosensitive channel
LLTWILLGIFFLLDLFVSMLRAAMLNARLPQLIDQSTENKERLEKTITTLEKNRLRATMRFIVVLLHALVLACAWVLILETGAQITFAGMLGLFALILIVLVGFEFLAERFPLKEFSGYPVQSDRFDLRKPARHQG